MAAANSTEDSCDVASSQTSADSGASGSVSTSIFSAASASASDTNLADVNYYDHDDNNKYCQTEELLTAEGTARLNLICLS